MSNCNFEWELAFSVGVIFFMWDLKTFFIKYSEYESQTKKVIPNVVSTISHFLSPTLTTFWQSVFVSLFSMVYTPPSTPTHKYFFCGGENFFVCLVAIGLENFKFFGTFYFWGT